MQSYDGTIWRWIDEERKPAIIPTRVRWENMAGESYIHKRLTVPLLLRIPRFPSWYGAHCESGRETTPVLYTRSITPDFRNPGPLLLFAPTQVEDEVITEPFCLRVLEQILAMARKEPQLAQPIALPPPWAWAKELKARRLWMQTLRQLPERFYMARR